jgi:hypothetical protein
MIACMRVALNAVLSIEPERQRHLDVLGMQHLMSGDSRPRSTSADLCGGVMAFKPSADRSDCVGRAVRRGNPICIEQGTGAVVLLDHEDWFHTRQFLNSSVRQLAECLLAYMGEKNAARFRSAVQAIDPAALAEKPG